MVSTPSVHRLEAQYILSCLQYLLKNLISMEINTQILKLILGLKKIVNISSLMSKKAKQYNIHEKCIIQTTKKEIGNIASRLNKHYSIQKTRQISEEEGGSQHWFWGEQKFFIWTVIYYAQALQIDTISMNHQQFQLITKLFPLKDQSFIRYQFASTFCDISTEWSSQEIELLGLLASEEKYQNKWKKISYEIFVRSQGRCFKSKEDCRNRWFNHANPIISKMEWTNEEDLKMMSCILKYGTRWAFISREIGSGRNEHMVKNRYRSLLRKFKISERTAAKEACRKILRSINLGSTQFGEDTLDNTQSNMHSQAKEGSPQKVEIQTEQISPQVPAEQGQSQLFEQHQAKEMLSIDEILKALNKQDRYSENQEYFESFDCWFERIIRNQEDSWTLSNYCL